MQGGCELADMHVLAGYAATASGWQWRAALQTGCSSSTSTTGPGSAAPCLPSTTYASHTSATHLRLGGLFLKVPLALAGLPRRPLQLHSQLLHPRLILPPVPLQGQGIALLLQGSGCPLLQLLLQAGGGQPRRQRQMLACSTEGHCAETQHASSSRPAAAAAAPAPINSSPTNIHNNRPLPTRPPARPTTHPPTHPPGSSS